MMNILRLSLAIVVLHNSILAAQQPKQVPPAPIPAQILVAKKVFVANAGGEAPWKDNAQFNGGVDRSYSQFYGALKTWGRYELVGAPADADLLFEIQFTVLSVAGDAAEGIGGRPYDPQFRLIIRDPKTSALLWAFTEHVPWAILQGNRDKNFDRTLDRIMSDAKGLTIQSPAAPDRADKP
jgi:hypothetical protein